MTSKRYKEKDSETIPSLSRRSFGKAAIGVGLGLAAAATGVQSAFSQGSNGESLNEKEGIHTTPQGYEGNFAVCTVLIVKEEMEKETDGVWDKHKKWLRETHGPWGMVSYSVAKNKEMKNPLNPASEETTGRITYVIHEIYRNLDGLTKHYSESPNGGYVEDFLKICTAEGNSVMVLQGAPVTHSLLPKDCDFPVTIAQNNEGVEKFFKKEIK